MSWLDKLKSGFKKTATILRFSGISPTETEALEEALIRADVGYETASDLICVIQKNNPVDIKEFNLLLKKEIERRLLHLAHPIKIDSSHRPFIILMTGVNGAGKTTTIGKLGSFFKDQGKKVSFIAADTFRAGAVAQLQQWGEKTKCPVYTTTPGADAAGLVFDGLKKAQVAGDEIVFIDTAGRLQNKVGLMDELKKIRRVIQKIDPTGPHESILVLDATVGQNAVMQVEAFQKVTPLSGLIMTKLDGTAKGGILLQLADRFSLPIYAIGVGEGKNDLGAFTASQYAESLLGDDDL